MDFDDNDRAKLIEEFRRLTANQTSSEIDIDRLFDQAVRWRFGTLISQAIVASNARARQH
jgi:hypothetical protein